MAVPRTPQTKPESDAQLLTLFHLQPDRAWSLFIARYSDAIFSYLRNLGFDYDDAMDRFVYVCEKLCEDDFRRLRTVRYAGQYGELLPWVRAVVKHLSINWACLEQGRKRPLKSLERLSLQDRLIFELYFWKGRSPSEIYEELRATGAQIEFVGVLDSLERIFASLGPKKLWRLLANLARSCPPLPLDDLKDGTGAAEVRDGGLDPEKLLIRKEAAEHVAAALRALATRERLIVQLRYEEGLATAEIAEILRLEKGIVRSSMNAALARLETRLRSVRPTADFVC